jgi:hypothetical protein
MRGAGTTVCDRLPNPHRPEPRFINMATLYIAEFANIGRDQGEGVQVATLAPLAEQTVVIGSSSAQSVAFGNYTNFVRLCSDSVCSIAVGTSPTASGVNLRLPANTPEYFQVTPGQKLACVANT